MLTESMSHKERSGINKRLTISSPTLPLSASFSLLAMILFVGNVQANHLSEELTQTLYPRYPSAAHRGAAHRYGSSFWLTLLILLLDIVTVVIVFFYQKARYQQKREQRKPVEYAPRDGILF